MECLEPMKQHGPQHPGGIHGRSRQRGDWPPREVSSCKGTSFGWPAFSSSSPRVTVISVDAALLGDGSLCGVGGILRNSMNFALLPIVLI